MQKAMGLPSPYMDQTTARNIYQIKVRLEEFEFNRFKKKGARQRRPE